MRGTGRLRQFHNTCLRSLQDQRTHKPYKTNKSSVQKQSRMFSPLDPEADIVKSNVIITNYMRNGQFESALRVFDSMPRRNLISWNSMILGYLSDDRFDLARQVFERMPERNLVSWNIMITGCVRNRNLGYARVLFNEMPKRDVVSWNALLSGYAQNGYVDAARDIFDRMPSRSSVSWNAILAAYVQNGRIEDARRLFESKEDWEMVSWNCMMSGYVKSIMLVDARMLFDVMPGRNVISWNTMISGYAQNGQLQEARRLFDESPVRDVCTWTAMVSGYVQNQMLDEARELFDLMPERSTVSWNAMISGYVRCKRMDLARELFEMMPCQNVSSWNTMIAGYALGGDIVQAQTLFRRMPRHDSISWAAIIAGYAQGGFSEEALCMFVEMKRDGGRVSRSSFTCTLNSCADIAALELGRQLHGQLVKDGFVAGCYVGNTLLSMYCKCGSIDEAYYVFGEIAEKDVVSWNIMIAGYARHGFGKEAVGLFGSMKATGIKPDDVTMVYVLSACSHAGLVDIGTEYFHSMNRDYGIIANSKHYTCMVDLLGRAGCLDDAQNLMKQMPFGPVAATWGALLGASRIHNNAELGEKAAKMLFEMQPENSGMYVLLSNLYAASGRWDDVDKMRLEMRERGVRKERGYSWIEVQNKIHTFSVGDCVHPDKNRIYAFLEDLDLLMKREGYVSSTKLVFHDVEEEDKEHMLKYHSEKLALAFGILTLPAGRPVRVIKNLRVCEDCHSAIKYISKIVGRLIILRDSHRFHHFNGGQCSCGDYW